MAETLVAAPRPPATGAPVLSVRDLCVEFDTRDGVRPVVQDVSLDVYAGRTLAVLGESGSGKSVTARSIMGLIDSPGRITGGQVLFEGKDLVRASAEERRLISGERIAIVFQDALSALNPVFSVGEQIAELLRTRRGLNRRAAAAGAVELMARVRIPAARQRAKEYPHQFSGGMRQRAMIAMALALDPTVLIADEPTTALDVTVQAQIMDLLLDLQDETGMGMMLITHDLGVVAEAADTLAVMYAGRIVERGRVDDVFARPGHPYTRGLLHSIPRLDREEESLWAIPGSPPTVLNRVAGCAFAGRCDVAIDLCTTSRPDLTELRPAGRASACHRHEEVLHGRV
ncbi:ABC transporter ATP-binding protein [Jiangella alkaliphila]|uniref:Peptide/nickel transport system ATP-binding protein n=1 Tax=Jiangella alkaliphila TaxID=419479 RepID=A0A1H2J854_9ACTN|nr:ABC transporter ATP-binding protein [Jiangella alkaliphila]SDU52228.1 peptide/nickel transport system ATP-binding protein [Jiangella alkaliphila]